MKAHFRGKRVRVEGNDRYREIWLTHPENRNALDVTLRDELFESLGAIAEDTEVRGIGLLSEGPDFCAGGDLEEFGTTDDPAMASHIRLSRSLPTLFHRLRGRLVVGIQGAAIGAGIELAAFARVIIASAEARFRLPELGMGLIPGAGGTVSIPRRIGAARTLQMILTGEWITAKDAKTMGLVDELSELGALRQRVREVAQT